MRKSSPEKNKKPPKKAKKPRKILSFFRYPSTILLDLLILFAVLAIIAGGYFFWKNPIEDQLLAGNITQTSVIYDRTGEHILYEIHGEENRKVISHEEIPDSMRITAIAAEDNGFYKHFGIDLKAIVRALKADVSSSEMSQGASTITQQLARNVFLSREKTFQRKISEAFLAVRIESHYTKDEILDMYLNEVPYGSNAYGVESAAQVFFGKSARDLTLDESALLSALPNATTFYSPYGNHQEDLKRRQQKILTTVQELGLADENAVAEAKSADTLEKIIPFKQSIVAPHFVFYVKEQLEKTYGRDAVEKGGMRVITTLDMEKQKLAEETIRNAVPEMQKDTALPMPLLFPSIRKLVIF